jgi:hypothetical protein
MSTGTWGRITAKGTTEQVALVRQALDEATKSPVPLETAVPRPYTIEFHSVEEFRARGYVFADGVVNEGRVVDRDTLWINARVARRQPRKARHIVRHEIAHVLPLTSVKKAELMLLMDKANGSHPTNWRPTIYVNRPSECYADTFAEAVSGVDSPWDDFAYYQLDIAEENHPQVVAIVFRDDTTPVSPEPLPEPLPLPSPELLAAQARIVELERRMTEINALSKEVGLQ